MMRATGDWRLGKRKFAKKLELVLDAGMTADQVLADAEAEFARVQRDMYVVARQLWSRYFPQQALPPDDATDGARPSRRSLTPWTRSMASRMTLLSDARATVDRIKTFIREHDILRLPEPDRVPGDRDAGVPAR